MSDKKERHGNKKQMRRSADHQWATGYEGEYLRNLSEAMEYDEAEVNQHFRLLQDKKELSKTERHDVKYGQDYVLKKILEREHFAFFGHAMSAFIFAFSTLLPREIRDMVYKELIPKYTSIWKYHDHRELPPALWALEHHQTLYPLTFEVLGEQFVWEYSEMFYRETTFAFTSHNLEHLPEIFTTEPSVKGPATRNLVRNIKIHAECSHTLKVQSSIGTYVWIGWASRSIETLRDAMSQMTELLNHRCHVTIQVAGPRNSDPKHKDSKWKLGLHSDIESVAPSIWTLHDLGCTVEIFFGSRKFKVAAHTKYFQYQKKLSKWALKQEKRYMSIYKKHVPSGRMDVALLRQRSVEI